MRSPFTRMPGPGFRSRCNLLPRAPGTLPWCRSVSSRLSRQPGSHVVQAAWLPCAGDALGALAAARDWRDPMSAMQGVRREAAESAARPPIFFGWRVVSAAFVIATFAFGVGFYGPSVFLNTLHVGRGWPVSLISAAITTHFLLSAAIVAHLPALHQRFGLAAVTRAGAILVHLACSAGRSRPSPGNFSRPP